MYHSPTPFRYRAFAARGGNVRFQPSQDSTTIEGSSSTASWQPQHFRDDSMEANSNHEDIVRRLGGL